jgi:hypothetical protein
MSLVVTAAELGRENGILFLSILQKKKEMEKKDQDRGGKKERPPTCRIRTSDLRIFSARTTVLRSTN